MSSLLKCDSACEKLYAITFPTALTTTGLTGPNGWFPNSKTCPGFEIPRVTRVVYGSDTVTESFVKIQDLLVVQKEETKKTIETIVFEGMSNFQFDLTTFSYNTLRGLHFF